MLELNLISPICYTGYGVAGANIALALKELGVKVNLMPINGLDFHKKRELENLVNEINPNAPTIIVWHQYDLARFPKGSYKIGFSFFELEPLTLEDCQSITCCDEFWTCSDWGVNVAKQSLYDQYKCIDFPIKNIPLGVDEKIFTRKEEKKSKACVFLNIGKWEVRKGHDILINAFNKTFSNNDNVELWIASDNPFLSQQEQDVWFNKVKNSPLHHKIKLIPKASSQHLLPSIINKADCGVFPAHAEAWNLDLLECMSCGLPIIATYNTGHTEFLNASNSLLIYTPDRELAYDGKWFHRQGWWPKIGEVEQAQLEQHLSTVYQLHKKKELKINEPGIKSAREFSWNNSATKIIQRIREIL